jgi:predicted ATPase
MRGQDNTGASITDDSRALLVDGPLPVSEFLPLAIDLARALDGWHQRAGPHGALSPEAVRIDPTGALQLCTVATAPAPLAYAAPEQSGRLERGTDERTDLYALGVLYYQLLSGRLPFDAQDSADWWRCHLTGDPVPLAGSVPDLPHSLGEIIHLLLEKAPDDRYQTARGLAIDLERCQEAQAAGTADTPLLLRMRDVPVRLVLSGRVYGRERQLGRLQAGYDRVAAGGAAELIVMTAETGLGKWATVAEFADSVVIAGGRTLRAVCSRDDSAPYAAIARLLADLAAQLAVAPAEDRARIGESIGSCGATLVELVPALSAVLGDQPPPADGPVDVARNRMYLAARRLFDSLARPGAPVVLAIRNIQWADKPTIELLRYVLAAPDAPALLAVVTCRIGDIGPRHPFQALMTDSRVPSSSLALRPLPDSALANMLADTLRSGMRDSSRLSRSVAARTGSNPLLVGHFLHELADRDLLAYTDDGATWQWQQRRVDKEPEVADIADLVRPRLGRFSARTRELLELAAVLGPRFDAVTLAAAARGRECAASGVAEVADQLQPAIRAELVTAGTAPGEFRWRHEQLQHAVLTCAADGRLAELRLAAGRALRPHPELLFEAVAHLNGAVDLLPRAHEGRRLAELNLAAGRRATRIGAADAAREFFATGLDLLDAGAWRRWPDLALRLHIASAEAERPDGNAERAESLLESAAAHVCDDTDRARLLRVHAMLRIDRSDRIGALRIGIKALRLLGLPVPTEPARWPRAARSGLERIRSRLDQGVLDRLAEAGGSIDPRVVIAASLIADLTYPTWPDESVVMCADRRPRRLDGTAGRDVLTTVGVELALAEGPTAATGFILVRTAAMLAQARHDEAAQRCAALSLRLLDRPGARYPAMTRAAAAVIGARWLDDPAEMVRELRAAYRTAVEDGDVRAAQRIGAVHSVHQFAVGTPLDQIAAEIDERWQFAHRHGTDEAGSAMTRLLDEAVSRLRGLACEAPPPSALDAAASLRMLRGEYGYYSLAGVTPTLAAAHLLGEYDEAAQLGNAVRAAAAHAPNSFLTAETAFSHALTLAVRFEIVDADERATLRATLNSLRTALDDLATRGQALFRARALLLAAEYARIEDNADQARSRYDRAISAARECGVPRLEGLAAERGGRHALASGNPGDAIAYLRRARHCYDRWRATAKLDQLDDLIATAIPAAGTSRPLDQLDLLTVVKAFQAISGESRLDRLVGVLLELLVQHSQAERGCLLLADGPGLQPAAEAEVDRESIRVTARIRGRLHNRVPIRLVEHVGRTREVLSGGLKELAEFATDPYLATHRPRSMLCAPIVRRSELLAVMYLENRQVPAAFSPSYLEVLGLLRMQAAIALENATSRDRLVAANRVLDATFDQLPVGLILLGPDLTVRRASPRAGEVTGIPIVSGTPMTELIDALTPIDEDGRPYRYEPGTTPVMKSVVPVHRTAVVVTPGGERLRLSTSSMPLRDEAGTLVGVAISVARA